MVKHLAVMQQYLALCEVMDKPQDMVEYKLPKDKTWINWGDSRGYSCHPDFDDNQNWRIKPKTIMIGKRECVAPVSASEGSYVLHLRSADSDLWFKTPADRNTARDAIIALLKGEE